MVCGGPEVCLRYLAKKLGQYGGDHVKDALLDRLVSSCSACILKLPTLNMQLCMRLQSLSK